MRLPPPPLVALGAGLVQRALTGKTQRPTVARGVAAGAVVLLSGATAASAGRRFRESGTTLSPVEPAEATVLVTEGTNAVSRNPMYLGLTGLLVGNAFRRGSWRALAPIGGFVLVMDRLQIPAEESALSARFGADYEAYRAAVPRWWDQRSARSLLQARAHHRSSSA
jgi:protein-S-isoprenylcysteine O-methyltransferase Ste14